MEEKIDYSAIIDSLRKNNSIGIYNFHDGVRVIPRYRYKGTTFKFTDDNFKDANGNNQERQNVILGKGMNIIPREEASKIKFLIGELDSDGKFKKGSNCKGYWAIKGSCAWHEMVQEGKTPKTHIEYIDPERYEKEREEALSVKKLAFRLVNKVLDKDEMVKDVAYAIKVYNRGASLKMLEGDVFQYVEEGNYDSFIDLFKDASDKNLKLNEAYMQLSYFRQGVSETIITMKEGGYYFEKTLLGYQEGLAVQNLFDNKELSGFFMQTLKKQAVEA